MYVYSGTMLIWDLMIQNLQCECNVTRHEQEQQAVARYACHIANSEGNGVQKQMWSVYMELTVWVYVKFVQRYAPDKKCLTNIN